MGAYVFFQTLYKLSEGYTSFPIASTEFYRRLSHPYSNGYVTGLSIQWTKHRDNHFWGSLGSLGNYGLPLDLESPVIFYYKRGHINPYGYKCSYKINGESFR
eukprot:scaffold2163_cov158-Ochromonas_danica.AAC.14